MHKEKNWNKEEIELSKKKVIVMHTGKEDYKEFCKVIQLSRMRRNKMYATSRAPKKEEKPDESKKYLF